MSNPPLVLLVDDDPTQLELMETMLVDTALDLVSVRSAREALEVLQARTPALVIADIHMPDPTGVDLPGWIRKVPRLRDTAVLLVSACADQPAREAAKREVVAEPMERPLTHRRFLSLVGEALGTVPQAERALAG